MSIWLKSVAHKVNSLFCQGFRIHDPFRNSRHQLWTHRAIAAFRADPRCQVVALAGSNAARTAELARTEGIAKGYGDWRALVEDKDVQAVAIATLPSLQAQIAIARA